MSFTHTKHIIFTILMLALVVSVKAQVFIGEGVHISNGSDLVVVEQEVTIEGETLNGEITVIQKGEKHIVRNQKDTKKIFYTKSTNKTPSKKKTKVAAKKTAAKKEIPVRYVNYESDAYREEDQAKKMVLVVKEDKGNASGGITISDSYRMQVSPIQDIILPIYIVTHYDERFSDCAELYEFEFPTAIYRPPVMGGTKLYYFEIIFAS